MVAGDGQIVAASPIIAKIELLLLGCFTGEGEESKPRRWCCGQLCSWLLGRTLGRSGSLAGERENDDGLILRERNE